VVQVDTVVFDKTGTLTEGKPKVTQIHSFVDDLSNDAVLQLAASVEAAANHPIAKVGLWCCD
jgi:P-type E1-E2 ATPase